MRCDAEGGGGGAGMNGVADCRVQVAGARKATMVESWCLRGIELDWMGSFDYREVDRRSLAGSRGVSGMVHDPGESGLMTKARCG